MTGGVTRLENLAGVVELTRLLRLPADFADGLPPYVRDKFTDLWTAIQQDGPGHDAE